MVVRVMPNCEPRVRGSWKGYECEGSSNNRDERWRGSCEYIVTRMVM